MASEGSPFWVQGEIVLRLDDDEPVRIARPYAVIGRTVGVDLRILDRRVSARHLYMHLDHRGLYAVDLATRTGTRFEDGPAPSSWLQPGQSAEVADHRITLISARILILGAAPVQPTHAEPRFLTNAAGDDLPRLALNPLPEAPGPWTISSELVFLGRSPACGVPVHGASSARVHAVIVRTARAPYIVNLIGAGLWLDGRAIREAAPMPPHAVLTIGSSRFEVLVGDDTPTTATTTTAPIGSSRTRPPDHPVISTPTSPSRPAPSPPTPASQLPAHSQPRPPHADNTAWATELVLPEGVPPPPPELFQSESQGAVLAWMMGVVQATQAEMMRRQHDFQMELIRAIRGLHSDNQDALEQHQARVDQIHRELASLREDIRQRFSGGVPAPFVPARPKGPPIKVPRAEAGSNDPATATAWLLDRVNRLDDANRATWRDLIGRLGGGKTQEPPQDY